MPRRKTDKKKKTLYISAEHWKQLSDIADSKQQTTADIVRAAIIEYLRKEERDEQEKAND